MNANARESLIFIRVDSRSFADSSFLSRVWRVVHGASEPSTYDLTRALFLRALGVIYFIAFASLAAQMLGLYGSQGILPIADFIQQHQGQGLAGIWQTPTVFWLNTSDLFIQLVPIVGALLSLLLILGITRRTLIVLIFILYLSLVAVGQDFLAFQWDYLLLEVGFIAIFVLDSNLVVWLYRWLVFRLMVWSGLVKILSGDPNWRNLTALDYHFMTQPLPNVIGFYVHHFPTQVHQFMVAATFFIELIVPFFIFAPRRLRFIAAALVALLQLQIFVTGNYNFFNLLCIALCILLLDDAALRVILPTRFREKPGVSETPGFLNNAPRRITRAIANSVAVVLFLLSADQFLAVFNLPTPGILAFVSEVTSPLRVVNFYGPFAVMTTTRPEIIVEGSNDGENWIEYEFKFKPGNVHRAPPLVEPHQPRLDWQLWFAALNVRTSDPRALLPELRTNPSILFNLQNYAVDTWFLNFAVRLLQGSPQVLALMERDPFPDAPPRFVRARLYLYRFTDVRAPMTTGQWWERDEQGMFMAPLTLGAR